MAPTLKNLRNIRNLKQKDVAVSLEITQSYLSTIERDNKPPITLTLFRKIIDVYKLSDEEIISFLRGQELELRTVLKLST